MRKDLCHRMWSPLAKCPRMIWLDLEIDRFQLVGNLYYTFISVGDALAFPPTSNE